MNCWVGNDEREFDVTAVASDVLSRLDAIKDLPTLPMVAQKLGRIVRDPHADASRVARIIEDDPAITARILKVVNSALYAGGERISSVQHAVARMGMSNVSSIAMSTSVFSAFGKSSGGFDREAFWRHSISCGIATTVVSERAQGKLSKRHDPEKLRLAGLIHDIGKIVFDQYFHDEFEDALRISEEEQIPLHEAETRVMGLDHGLAGGWLADKWNLSEDLLQVVRRHHAPDAAAVEHWETVALCHTADYICVLQGIGDSRSGKSSFDQTVWKRLGLQVSDIPEVVARVEEESRKSEVLMSFAKE